MINTVSMPHAALFVVQLRGEMACFANWEFQCRTQHCLWCNRACAWVCVAEGVSMPHAALFVVQQMFCVTSKTMNKFQCRTQHFMWCNSVARSPCPARGERAFWKVVDFLCRFSLMGRHFHRKIAASISVFPCAAQGCAKMENRDGRMRLCGIAVAFSTFLHHGCIISENP